MVMYVNSMLSDLFASDCVSVLWPCQRARRGVSGYTGGTDRSSRSPTGSEGDVQRNGAVGRRQ